MTANLSRWLRSDEVAERFDPPHAVKGSDGGVLAVRREDTRAATIYGLDIGRVVP